MSFHGVWGHLVKMLCSRQGLECYSHTQLSVRTQKDLICGKPTNRLATMRGATNPSFLLNETDINRLWS